MGFAGRSPAASWTSISLPPDAGTVSGRFTHGAEIVAGGAHLHGLAGAAGHRVERRQVGAPGAGQAVGPAGVAFEADVPDLDDVGAGLLETMDQERVGTVVALVLIQDDARVVLQREHGVGVRAAAPGVKVVDLVLKPRRHATEDHLVAGGGVELEAVHVFRRLDDAVDRRRQLDRVGGRGRVVALLLQDLRLAPDHQHPDGRDSPRRRHAEFLRAERARPPPP